MRTAPRRYFALLAVALLAAAGCGTGPAAGPAAVNAPAPRQAAHMDTPDMPDTAAHVANADKPERPATPTTAAAPTVVIDNFTFDPPELTVPVGAQVTWVNRDDVPHTATSVTKPRAFDSGALDTDGTYSHRFTAVGEYEYFCAVHPHMTGRVIVK